MNRFESAIEKDLEILMAAFSKRDDIVLFRELPQSPILKNYRVAVLIFQMQLVKTNWEMES